MRVVIVLTREVFVTVCINLNMMYRLQVSRLLGIRHSQHAFARFSSAEATKSNNTAATNESKILFQFVPQSVCVVTSQAAKDEKQKPVLRGMTCSSFTNVSNSPPILSFSVWSESAMRKTLESSSHFGVHVLNKKQLHLAVRFALRARGKDPFDGLQYKLNQHNVPIFPDCVGVFECEKHDVQKVGDHHVFFGAITHCTLHGALHIPSNGMPYSMGKLNECEPLVFFMRQYLTVGDSVFMRAFEEQQLPFEQWTHDAHLRMAFNYLSRFGKQRAAPLIRNGIRQFNEANKVHIRIGYHETITTFFIQMLEWTIGEWRKSLQAKVSEKKASEHEVIRDALSFEKFLEFPLAQQLLSKDIVHQYYSEERINSVYARHSFVPPDRKPLPVPSS